MSGSGELLGIGVGPGDPDLITLKGLAALRAAPVLAYPAPETGESLARAIVAPHLEGMAKIEIAIRMPIVAARFPAQEVYDRAAREIGAHLDAGRDVACICEGDPFFYGSFSFLFERMAGRYPARVIPGVSSLTACAASAGAPLATRNDVLAVVPATLDEDELRAKLSAVGRGGDHQGGAAPAEGPRGARVPRSRRTGARYIEHATMASERILPLSGTGGARAPYFSMVLVHRRGAAWK